MHQWYALLLERNVHQHRRQLPVFVQYRICWKWNHVFKYEFAFSFL